MYILSTQEDDFVFCRYRSSPEYSDGDGAHLASLGKFVSLYLSSLLKVLIQG